VPRAKAHILADGLDGVRHVALKKGKRLDWVISNPPVHAGYPDDFAVLQGLIAGMPMLSFTIYRAPGCESIVFL
jgi:16S rRNA G1207 methylase RsmC